MYWLAELTNDKFGKKRQCWLILTTLPDQAKSDPAVVNFNVHFIVHIIEQLTDF